jgi:prevent-host-death family protein
MKNISINKLQDQLSSSLKEVEAGEVYEISRYSTPVAYLVSVDEYKRLKSGEDCKKCVSDLRKIADKVRK